MSMNQSTTKHQNVKIPFTWFPKIYYNLGTTNLRSKQMQSIYFSYETGNFNPYLMGNSWLQIHWDKVQL